MAVAVAVAIGVSRTSEAECLRATKKADNEAGCEDARWMEMGWRSPAMISVSVLERVVIGRRAYRTSQTRGKHQPPSTSQTP
jgi:hypothetical protein